MKIFLVAALAIASVAPAHAQKEIPKADGFDQCPLGYVNTLGTDLRLTYLLRSGTHQWRSLLRRVG